MDERQRLEQVAAWYDSATDFDYHLVKYGARLICERARGPAVLEMGCSSGMMTEELVKRFPIVVIVEGSSTYAAKTRELVKEKVRVCVALFEEFVPDRRFNAIVLAGVLEHVTDPVGLLKQASTWLEDGGSLHVIVPNAGALNRRLGVVMGMLSRLDELHQRDLRMGHRRVYNRETLMDDVHAAQLRMVHLQGILLKPLSNAQMRDWSPQLLDALYEVGKELPEYCSELYVECVPEKG